MQAEAEELPRLARLAERCAGAVQAEGRRREALAGAATAQRCAAVACGRAVGAAEALLEAAARLDVRLQLPLRFCRPLSLPARPALSTLAL